MSFCKDSEELHNNNSKGLRHNIEREALTPKAQSSERYLPGTIVGTITKMMKFCNLHYRLFLI